ncbi:MAG: VIT1/CCC1 transporter family protein [Chloroflexota bacterium]|nr:MAG: hypothetical protein DLM70_04010 [Chloroflexota bacterium]
MSWHIAGEQHSHPYELLGDLLLGLNDGVATTLVFALSVAGASTSRHTVIVAGLAEMLAGGVSMSLGGFASAQAENEAAEHQIAVERHEIEVEPEEERAELREIYREKGFSGTNLTSIVDYLTSDKERWLQSMIRDELLLRPGEFRSPWRVSGTIGLAFMVGAFVPLLPFLIGISYSQIAAACLSISTLFVTGALRSRYTDQSWTRSGGQMLVIGLVGAVAGVLIGFLLSRHF